jgi:hypothetical protein
MEIIRESRLVVSTKDRNQGVWEAWRQRWAQNTAVNFPGIKRDFKHADRSLVSRARVNMQTRSIVRAWRGPAIVLGSGPSLDNALPLLRDWKGALFATGSNAKCAARFGRRPDYIGVFDAGASVYGQLYGHDWRGSTLLTNPCSEPSVINLWRRRRWPRLYYTMGYEGMQWFDEMLPSLYPEIGVSLMNAGCTSNNLVQAAWFMGYGPIFLVGMDFAFTRQRYRCSFYTRPWAVRRYVADYARGGQCTVRAEWDSRNPLDPWLRIPSPQPPAGRERIYDVGNGLFTFDEQIEYKLALFMVWSLDRGQLFNCSPLGLIAEDEMPYIPLQEVIDHGGRGFDDRVLSSEEIVARGHRVHARHETVPNARDGGWADQALHAVGGADGRPAEGAEGRAEEPRGGGQDAPREDDRSLRREPVR